MLVETESGCSRGKKSAILGTLRAKRSFQQDFRASIPQLRPLTSRASFAKECPIPSNRIFVQPRSGSSFHNIAQEAYDVLRKAGIASARLGGIINGQGVVLVDLVDVAESLEALKVAGLRAVADP